MKNQYNKLNNDIVNMTMCINDSTPELTKYLEELPMPDTNMDGSQVSAEDLQDYYDSLDTILQKYIVNHQL